MFKEKLKEALDNKITDIKSFVWKGRKEEINGELMQKEQRLVDASEEELRGYYKHCESMLNNPSKDFPGRYPLLEIIKDQRTKCNVELFLRWLEGEMSMPRYRFMEALRDFLDKNKEVQNVTKLPIAKAVGNCPEEFINIPIELVLEGCLDKLGRFNKQHITLTFILKQGLWFTAQESKDLTERLNLMENKDKLQVAKERLGLDKPGIKLFISPKGLNFTQLRSMVNLKSRKYSELTTDQLKTLRNRILFSLEDEVLFHIGQWEMRKDQISQVCEANGCSL